MREVEHVLHMSNRGSKCESCPCGDSALLSGACDEKEMENWGGAGRWGKQRLQLCRSATHATRQWRASPASVAMPRRLSSNPPLPDGSPLICKRTTACAFVEIGPFILALRTGCGDKVLDVSGARECLCVCVGATG